MAQQTAVSNWAGTQACNPLEVFHPQSYEALKSIIDQARAKNVRVHVYGSFYSWSNIVCIDGYLVHTTHLNRILSIDHAKHRVRVESGMFIKNLNEQLTAAGLSLSNQSDTQEQTVAGALATAAHGTGQTGTLSDFVVKIELLTAQGELLTISAQKKPELFAAARVSLGALGIVYAVTLQCEQLFFVQHERMLSDMQTLIKSYHDLYQQYDFFMFRWNPYTDRVLVYTWDRGTGGSHENRWWVHLRENVVASCWLIKCVGLFLKMFKWLTPRVMDFYLWGSVKKPHYDYSHVLLPQSEEIPCIESEIAVPMKHLPQAAYDVQTLINKYHEIDPERYYMATFRFVKAESNVYLSPAADRYTVYISLMTHTLQGNEDFFKAFEEAMYVYGGRPHWGKINFLTKKKVLELYGAHARKFMGIRRSLDPHTMFMNNGMRKFFED